MTLDCTNLKPGDRVRLRNGEIRTVKENDGTEIPICLDDNNWYYVNGRQGYDDSPRSIAEILPPKPPNFAINGKPHNVQPDPNRPLPSPASATLTIDGVLDGIEHPHAINCNGKRYVPADSPSLYTGIPFTIITHPEKGVVALRLDGIKYTPADAWPEPITDRAPTKEDEDDEGYVQLYDDGRWAYIELEQMEDHEWECGWARTSRWKLKPTPAHTREEVLDILRGRLSTMDSPSTDTTALGTALLDSIITHLEATND